MVGNLIELVLITRSISGSFFSHLRKIILPHQQSYVVSSVDGSYVNHFGSTTTAYLVVHLDRFFDYEEKTIRIQLGCQELRIENLVSMYFMAD